VRLQVKTPTRGGIARLARAAACAIALAGCTPQEHLLMALIPDGTFPMLLSHLEKTSDTNRRRLAELDARGDWHGMVKFAGENLARDPSNSDWWMVKGYAYTQLKLHRQAAECYSEMVRLAPDDMVGWNLLAESQRAMGQSARAVQTLDNALLIRRDSPATWFVLGESYSDLGRDAPAAQAYRQAVQLNRSFAQAWYGLGRVYARQGYKADFEQVVQTLERLNPALAQQLAKEQAGALTR
jgi:tetratricopeptide (TPR) repeat protein